MSTSADDPEGQARNAAFLEGLQQLGWTVGRNVRIDYRWGASCQFVVSIVGILVFVGLTAWDTQSIKEQYAENFDAKSQQKLAVFGAFSLYLNFINIFQLLLNFTGQREE